MLMDIRTEQYSSDRSRTAFFRRSKEPLGGLGNMAGGYPLTINGLQYSSSEALYQCARYPHLPDVQTKIREAHNGFAAKLVAKQYYSETRPHWEEDRISVMLNVIALKTQQNFTKIKKIMEEVGSRPIVEWSSKDSFWGAMPKGDILEGYNVLGKLWDFLKGDILDGSIRYHYPDLTLFPTGPEELVDFIQY